MWSRLDLIFHFLDMLTRLDADLIPHFPQRRELTYVSQQPRLAHPQQLQRVASVSHTARLEGHRNDDDLAADVPELARLVGELGGHGDVTEVPRLVCWVPIGICAIAFVKAKDPVDVRRTLGHAGRRWA